MAMLVTFTVIFPRFSEIPARWDRIFTTLFGDILPYRSRAISFVGKDMTAGNVHSRQQSDSRFGIIGLTAGQNKIDDLTGTVDESVNFCGLSAAASADILPVFSVYSPFFAPALCGCALMDVLSMLSSFSSAFAFSFRKIRYRVPSSRHLQKRLYTVL